MKHNSLLLLLFPVFIISCQSPSKGERLVLEYLQNNTNGTEFSIIEFRGPDSLYTPFNELHSLLLTAARRNAELSKELSDDAAIASYRERRAAFAKTAKLIGEEIDNFRATKDEISITLHNPELIDKKPNRIGYYAKYKVDGILKEDYFFMELDGKTVGHTMSNLKETNLEVAGILLDMSRLGIDAEEYSRW